MERKFIVLCLFLVFGKFSGVFSQDVEIPVLRLVTVDRASQQVFVKWTVEQAAVLDGYVVKRQIFNFTGVVDGSIQNIAEINDRNLMSYTDISMSFGPANPGIRPETYRISSFSDITGIRELSNMSNPLSTIYLHPVSFDQCREQNSLIWTTYHGFVNGPDGYRVYYAETPAGMPVLVADLPKTDTAYIHRQVLANTQYFYFIVAYHETEPDSSVSNQKSVTTVMPPVPTIMNADFASVEMYNQVSLRFTVDPDAEVYAYHLLKSNQKNGPWDTIARFPRGTAQINTVDFVKTMQETAYYKVVAMNNCRLESRQSNLAHNMVLEAFPDPQLTYTNRLNWQPYTSWLGGVEGYSVYRSIDGAAFEEIAQLNATILTYTDPIEQFVLPQLDGQSSKGHFCYYVEATESSGNPFGIVGVSKSNSACAQQAAVVFIPNAFNPKSSYDENRTFKPVVSFANDYHLLIYNRWGEIIFRSTDPLHGWDGTFKGKLMPKATYVYYLKYRTTANQLVEKSGQVNLVY